MIQLKRVYQEPGPRDGMRILVDRLWPRGVKKEAARIQEWRKDLAPSDSLRRWFKHDPENGLSFVSGIERNSAVKTTWKNFAGLPASRKRKRITLINGLLMNSITTPWS
jgi:uncharacterized protein YeaO (DUF488 family)